MDDYEEDDDYQETELDRAVIRLSIRKDDTEIPLCTIPMSTRYLTAHFINVSYDTFEHQTRKRFERLKKLMEINCPSSIFQHEQRVVKRLYEKVRQLEEHFPDTILCPAATPRHNLEDYNEEWREIETYLETHQIPDEEAGNEA